MLDEMTPPSDAPRERPVDRGDILFVQACLGYLMHKKHAPGDLAGRRLAIAMMSYPEEGEAWRDGQGTQEGRQLIMLQVDGIDKERLQDAASWIPTFAGPKARTDQIVLPRRKPF